MRASVARVSRRAGVRLENALKPGAPERNTGDEDAVRG